MRMGGGLVLVRVEWPGGGGGTRARRGRSRWFGRHRKETKKFETFREFKTIGQLVGSDREARPSVQYVQYRVLRNGI
jgi:hypothetical protein